MAVQKLSQIAAAGGAPAVTDQAVFVTGGAVDNLVTVTQLGGALPLFTSTTRGQVPLSGGGTTNFLRADGNFAVPPGTPTAPGGSPNQFQFNSAGSFGGTVGHTWDSTNQAATLASIANPAASTLTLTGGTALTTSQPVLNATQTWNAGGVAFSGIKFAVTNTASTAGSRALDLLGGVSGTTSISAIYVDGSAEWVSQSLAVTSGFNFALWSGGVMGWSATTTATRATTPDTGLSRTAAKVVQIGDGGANANGWIQTAGDLRLGSDVGFTSNVVLATIMSVALQAGRSYAFDVYFSITGSAGGFQAAMVASGGLTATAIQYDGYVVDNAAAGTKGAAQASALGTVVANPATITGPASAMIRGLITVNVAGTIQIQASQGTSSATTTTVKRGSWAFFRDTP